MIKLPNFIVRFFGNILLGEIKPGGMTMDKWKSTAAHTVAALVGIYTSFVSIYTNDLGHSLSPKVASVAGIILTVLSALGLYESHVQNQ